MLLSTAYFPPVQWFSLAARGNAYLEACENYQKQSYRNRCYILGPQGPQMLQVPVVHGGSMAIRDILVDYSTPWVVRTERALDTAYESAAFYEYLRDEVFSILESRPEHLWDLNLRIAEWCLGRIGLPCALVPTTDFAVPGTQTDDFRYSVHPKLPAAVSLSKPYYQVFRDRMGGFTPGLSILDLVFNEGPDSIDFLGA